MIVVDTNILAKLFLPGQRAAAAEELMRRDSAWAAPVLWRSEFRNVVVGYLRRGAINFDTASIILGEAESLMAPGEHVVDSLSVLACARESDCTAYDCEFVALARHLGTVLVTEDRQLLRAFPDCTRPLVPT